MTARIDAKELTPDVRRKLKIRKTRESQFSKDKVRSWSLRVLAMMADLTQEQRRRVLEHAGRINRV